MSSPVDIDRVADEHELTLIRVRPGDKYCQANGQEYYDNKSAYSYLVIYLGIYDDPELELISFFHELGHYLVGSTCELDKYASEKLAWMRGLAEAGRYGVKFSENALEWARKQVETYAEYESVFCVQGFGVVSGPGVQS